MRRQSDATIRPARSSRAIPMASCQVVSAASEQAEARNLLTQINAVGRVPKHSRMDPRHFPSLLDGEAIEHSNQLATSLTRRHFNNHSGLTIVVLDQSSRTIHEEVVYPEGQQK